MNRLRRAAVATALALVLPLPIAGASSALAAPAPAAADLTATPASAAPAEEASAAQPDLPRPTGRHAVGRSTLHLVDGNRPDPWVPSAGARQLMVSMYYPARPGTGGPATPYLTADEARLLLDFQAPGGNLPSEAITGLRPWARTDASPAPGRFPLVVLSPGFTLPRATLTGLAEDLASRGYVVAAVDHTYETSGTTFPDGRTLTCAVCQDLDDTKIAAVPPSRAKDISFVLDRLTGPRPAWPHARMIDRDRIGMAGHSIGGNSAASTMAADRRIRAGINMDGKFFDPFPAAGLDGRPFLVLGTQSVHNPSGWDTSWNTAWSRMDGWKRWLSVTGSNHGSFTDGPLIEARAGLTDPEATLAPLRAENITRAYVGAFFDLQLKGVPQRLLDRPSPAYPEVVFQRP
ncbi:alpha/beta hydrolase family protein [Kitasatospora sp. NPDC056651]|uniref:alpha/beta hydrolase family protein n=1 Tax=Kitasatospora sp. NPDC056651 TaxID=3345892 RepID=UPI00368FE87C